MTLILSRFIDGIADAYSHFVPLAEAATHAPGGSENPIPPDSPAHRVWQQLHERFEAFRANYTSIQTIHSKAVNFDLDVAKTESRAALHFEVWNLIKNGSLVLERSRRASDLRSDSAEGYGMSAITRGGALEFSEGVFVGLAFLQKVYDDLPDKLGRDTKLHDAVNDFYGRHIAFDTDPQREEFLATIDDEKRPYYRLALYMSLVLGVVSHEVVHLAQSSERLGKDPVYDALPRSERNAILAAASLIRRMNANHVMESAREEAQSTLALPEKAVVARKMDYLSWLLEHETVAYVTEGSRLNRSLAANFWAGAPVSLIDSRQRLSRMGFGDVGPLTLLDSATSFPDFVAWSQAWRSLTKNKKLVLDEYIQSLANNR